MCLGCHADPAPAALRGARFEVSDGVGCEACHGGSERWLSAHYAVGATHASNVAKGLYPLDEPRARAERCLDCHFGSTGAGQFVTHRIMSAGHPRLAFELDLFTALQKHHDEDADYVRRKGRTPGVKVWAVGQAMALDRALSLFGSARGTDGLFPEFYFFDCRTCHRSFSDDPEWRPVGAGNPGRPLPSGFPTFNDENMLMLSATVRAIAPNLAGRFAAETRAFHAAFATDRPAAIRAANQLAATSRQLATTFERASFTKGQTLAILRGVLADQGPLYTDYQGATQAVMAADTLLADLEASGGVTRADAKRVRTQLDRAYAAVRTPEGFRPDAFRQVAAQLASSVNGLQ